MRILHISEAFGGGLRTAIINYVNATPQFEHSIFARTRVGHETIEIPQGSHFDSYSGKLPGFFASSRRVVADGDFDIVHLHSSFAGALRAILPPSTRIVYSPHCYAMEANNSRARLGIYRVAERFLARRPQLMLAVSPREAELGRRLNPRILSHQVPNAAPLWPGPVEGGAGGGPEERPTIAMLGRICEQKDPHFFAEVAAAGQGRYHYRWIGDGDDGIEALTDVGVEITGWVTPQQARKLLASSSLYVHTAAWEGGPLATLEAADVGCAVMCRSIPSMESLGYHIAGHSPRETAAAIDRFFDDPTYERLVRTTTREVLAACSMERMATELVNAYSTAMDQLPDRPEEPANGR